MINTSFVSESVCEGHPDKICDQISDSIVDEAISIDKNSRVAVETLVTKNKIVLAGEVTCPKKINFEKITRNVIKDLNYDNEIYEFTDKSPMSIYIHEQSPDIAKGVDNDGAGDQGMMYGYATDETKEYMPLTIILAHKLAEEIDKQRKSGQISFLRPDGKTEVKVRYEKGIPVAVEKIVIAVPHYPKINPKEVKNAVYKKVVCKILSQYRFKLDEKNVIVNGTGKWEIGGPASDTGVTGRKIIVDTYGGIAHHGGGCFSGKDPTKVDRSGAYACRYLAKNIVANKLAKKCEVRVAYVIGIKEPLDIQIETFDTKKVSDKKLFEFAKNVIEFNVPAIIEKLHLRQSIYRDSARYGHFGRDVFPWEQMHPVLN